MYSNTHGVSNSLKPMIHQKENQHPLQTRGRIRTGTISVSKLRKKHVTKYKSFQWQHVLFFRILQIHAVCVLARHFLQIGTLIFLQNP